MTDAEKFKEILAKLYKRELYLKTAYSDILDLFKSMLPEEENFCGNPDGPDYTDGIVVGHNEFRSQLLAKIEGMRKS